MNAKQSGTLVRVAYLDTLRVSLPYFRSVEAGFPSPADDYIEETLNLEEYLVRNPEATFFLRVRGQSMIDAGIFEDAILIVDRSLRPKNGDTIIAVVNDEFTVKWYQQSPDGEEVRLLPANRAFEPIVLRRDQHLSFMVWGVVTQVIHKPARP